MSQAGDPLSSNFSNLSPSTSANPNPRAERRRRRRALISAPVRVRGLHLTDADNPDEVSITLDVSRIGLLFLTQHPGFCRDMEVAVTFPYSQTPTAIHAEQCGRVARVFELSDGRRGVAIALGKPAEDKDAGKVVDACGRELANASATAPKPAVDPAPIEEPKGKGPLVLVVDADDSLRESLKTYLANDGYAVIAVNNGSDAREVLNIFTPALLIAEVEGEDLPGFDLCAHVKATDRLRRIPVVLTTTSAYPSDYSNAHSLGAVVCMAKPYKQERLGHVVRLLAPNSQMKQQPTTCAAAPTSKAAAVSKSTALNGVASQRRWRFRLS